SELLTSGYILIRSDRPVSATVEYTVLDKTREIVTEAGISAIEPALRMVGPAATIAQLNLDTAVAIVNTANSFAEVTLFVAEDGSEEHSTLELGPGEHRAGFLRELFPSLSEDFQGTIIVTSDVPIAATILRTKNGLPLASFQF